MAGMTEKAEIELETLSTAILFLDLAGWSKLTATQIVDYVVNRGKIAVLKIQTLWLLFYHRHAEIISRVSLNHP